MTTAQVVANLAKIAALHCHCGPSRLDDMHAADCIVTAARRAGIAEPSPTWPYVLAFALRMERKLDENRHKGNREGWIKDDPIALFRRLRDEAAELGAALTVERCGCRAVGECTHPDPKVGDEAADVANFAMMIADAVGDLEP